MSEGSLDLEDIATAADNGDEVRNDDEKEVVASSKQTKATTVAACDVSMRDLSLKNMILANISVLSLEESGERSNYSVLTAGAPAYMFREPVPVELRELSKVNFWPRSPTEKRRP